MVEISEGSAKILSENRVFYNPVQQVEIKTIFDQFHPSILGFAYLLNLKIFFSPHSYSSTVI